ncbi:MAG TPA: hypothetical protein VEC08_00365 [Nitrososphaerales archaeon]|nr:hypothetical protein [Nitrososphaerales archaeon]
MLDELVVLTEFVEVVVVEAEEVAARTQGDTRMVAAKAIAATAASCAVLVFIFRRISDGPPVFTGFPRWFHNLYGFHPERSPSWDGDI